MWEVAATPGTRDEHNAASQNCRFNVLDGGAQDDSIKGGPDADRVSRCLPSTLLLALLSCQPASAAAAAARQLTS